MELLSNFSNNSGGESVAGRSDNQHHTNQLSILMPTSPTSHLSDLSYMNTLSPLSPLSYMNTLSPLTPMSAATAETYIANEVPSVNSAHLSPPPPPPSTPMSNLSSTDNCSNSHRINLNSLFKQIN
jgi:hypothetical protein